VPLDIVKSQGRIHDSSYLGGFELGNEIYLGKGSTNIKKFHVDVRPKSHPTDKLHHWSFDDQPLGKIRIDGQTGFDTGVTNDSQAKSRTVVARFRLDEHQSNQVIYQEGGTSSGLSIGVAAGQIHVSNWNTIDGTIKHSVGSSPLISPMKSSDKHPDSYTNLVAMVDDDTHQMTVIVNGKTGAKQVYHGLAANRGTTTLGYTDVTLRHIQGVSGATGTMVGVLDEVSVYDRALTPDEISTFK
jgi:hypothetical protein